MPGRRSTSSPPRSCLTSPSSRRPPRDGRGVAGGERAMGRIVYAAAMSHVLHPEYYDKNVGPRGRALVEALIAVVREMGVDLAARRPDAIVIVADDHLNVFSFDAVPAMCVRIGRTVRRMVQEDAIEFDKALDGLPDRYPVHEGLAERILEREHEARQALTGKELHASGSHELLNWMVLLGAVAPAKARVRFFGEMGRIDLAALEWALA